MKTREEAVASLLARGLHAQPRDCYAAGAFAVASQVVDIGDGIDLLEHMVVVFPTECGWSIASEFPAEVENVSLAEAVNAAETLVHDLRDFGLPKRFLALPNSTTDQTRESLVSIPRVWLGRWETTYYRGRERTDSGSLMRWDIGSSEFQTPRGNFAVVSVAEIHQEAQAVYEIRLSDDSVVLTLWPGEEPEDGLWLVWIQDGEPTGRYFLRRQLPVVPVEKIT